MNLLAVETSSPACSVALLQGDEVTESHIVEPRAHTRVLIPMITGLLDQAGIHAGDLDGIVLGNGPGSFIGMRIGAAVVQGLAYGVGLKIVPVSSLAAVAAQCMAEEGAEHVAVAQDARMEELYLGFFSNAGGGLPMACRAEAIAPVDALCWPDGDRLWTAAGEGWYRYPELAKAAGDRIGAISALQMPRARYLLGAGALAIEGGLAIAPELLQPAYLRNRVATPPEP